MTTTPLLLGKYTVTTGTPIIRHRTITGEYVISGSRGGTYRTYRTEDGTRFQFIAESGRFCALYGNYTLPVQTVEACCVTLTDDDRI